MTFTRRQFIKAGMAMSAASAFPSIWWRVREAAAALEPCETGVNLVIVHIGGGNDGINMVVPKSDGTGQNRTAYDAVRLPGGINIPEASLAATQIGNDPLHNGELALHPHMTGLKALYDSGNLAVLCGVHYPKANLSHDVSSTIWYRADPSLAGPGSGWMGRTLDTLCTSSTNAVPAVDTDGQLTPLFYGNTSVFAFDSLSELVFPVSDAVAGAGLTSAYRSSFSNLYGNAAANGANFLKAIGATGATAADKVDLYGSANESLAGNLNGLIRGTGSFGVPGVRQSFNLAKKLRTVFALMKGAQPGNQTLGCRIFRVSIEGFDTHSDQGGYTNAAIATKVQTGFPGEYHGLLMHRIDRALSAFWADVQGDAVLKGSTVVMTFSEFGRRVEENGDHDQHSGTDHGTAAPQFVLGPTAGESAIAAHLVGGVYGAYPELDTPNLDANGNMVYQLDFRHIYGEIINRWLGIDTTTAQSILGGYDYLADPKSADFLV
jgi:uncharacterized protein (DUF1501 family)